MARVPYLNSVPYFHGVSFGEGVSVSDAVPRALARKTAAGEADAGLLPSIEFFRQESAFERVGPFGIAVRGRVQSVLLFSRLPIRQLDGATIAVTDDSSTSACLLRLLLEGRYQIAPSAYVHSQSPDADALLLIGDEALRMVQSNASYPFEYDLAFEWWLWQHLPFVFAVWAVRKTVPADQKKRLELALSGALGVNTKRYGMLAQTYGPQAGLSEPEAQAYLANLAYRLSQFEEEGLRKFRDLADEHHLL